MKIGTLYRVNEDWGNSLNIDDIVMLIEIENEKFADCFPCYCLYFLKDNRVVKIHQLVSYFESHFDELFEVVQN